MSPSGKLITALTVIVLVVILIGIVATFQTFTAVCITLELILSTWGKLFLQLLLTLLSISLVLCVVLGTWLAVVEIQGRRQKHIRFAPTPEGYYEALPIGDGFIRPADNVILQVPHTYSPHIAISQAKGTVAEPPIDDATILELFNTGMNVKDIAQATGKTQYYVQKITRGKKRGDN